MYSFIQATPCDGSSEIFPVPKNDYVCPGEGFFVDPENCRWFYACRDHTGDGNYIHYEFRYCCFVSKFVRLFFRQWELHFQTYLSLAANWFIIKMQHLNENGLQTGIRNNYLACVRIALKIKIWYTQLYNTAIIFKKTKSNQICYISSITKFIKLFWIEFCSLANILVECSIRWEVLKYFAVSNAPKIKAT